MKPLIVYYTRTGNTVPVAEAMATALDADLTTADAVTDEQLADRPLIGLGSGIYFMSHHRLIYALAERLAPGSRVFFFTTSGVTLPLFVRYYQRRLQRKLESRGVVVAGQWHCPGHDRQRLLKSLNLNRGRPDRSDCSAAERFARGLR